MSRKGHRLGAASVIATILFAAPIAFAYILPAEAILGSVSKRRADIALQSLVVEGRVEVGEGAPYPVWEALVPGKARRVEHKLEGRTEVVTTVGARQWRHALGEKAGRPDIIKDDLFLTFLGAAQSDPNGQRAVSFAERLKIDTSVVSLSRLDRRVAFVIGAKPWEPNKPQIWIDKRLRVPVRLVYVDGSGNVVDQRLLGFGSAVTGEWYPRHFEVWKNGTLERRTTYDRVLVNEPVEPNLLAAPSS